MSKFKLSYLGSAILSVIALIIILFQPIETLSSEGQVILGTVLLSLCIWIFKPFKLTYAIGALIIVLVGLFIGLPTEVIFSGFTQSALWTLVPAFFFGYTLQKTGLGKRVAMGIIKLCPPTYKALIFAWIPIGVILSILTPATTVRVAIMLPIAIQCCELFGLKKGSKANSLVLLTSFAMALVPGSGWLTGVIWGPFIQGQINGVYAADIVNFGSWISTLLLPIVITTILLVVFGLIFLKPEEKPSRELFLSVKQEKLPKTNLKEIIAAILLIGVFVMSLTNNLHGIHTVVVCLAAMLGFFIFGVLDTKDFNAAANWNLVIFIAVALGLGAIFEYVGISEWLSGILVPLLEPIAGNPWLFTFGVALFLFVWSMIDVAMFIPTIAIMVPILPDIQAAYGIDPMFWVAMFIIGGNAFFLGYQNMWAVMSKSIASDKDRPWLNSHMSLYGVMYAAASLIALVAAVPLWIHLGYFGG